MHTSKTTERQGLIKLLGLAVAGATLLAGMVALPVTKASATPEPNGFDTEDGFQAGEINTTKTPTLTVTKYLSTSIGHDGTGSIIDKPAAGFGTPAMGIVFNVKEVKPKDTQTVADINVNDPSTYQLVDPANYFAGVTNGQGVINAWFTNTPAGAPTTTAKEFPKGVHYYVMIENRAASPAFINGTIDPSRYQTTPDSFFGLPYKTKTPDGSTSGYIYNLHVYPKNVDNSSLSKVVTGTADAAGHAIGLPVPGNYISYKVSQQIFNAPSVAGDGLLQIPEITGSAPHLRVVDRMSTSLELDTSSVAVSASWTTGSTPGSTSLDPRTDYTMLPTSDNAPHRINSAHTADTFFPGAASGAHYHTFDFFNNPSKISDLVAAGGPAAGASVINIDITYRARVTALGDTSNSGGLVNDVASDNIDNPGGVLPGGHTNVPSATAAFGKLKKNNSNDYDPLAGAVFRLADPADAAKYLASDGLFYGDNETLPSGVSIYQATSSTAGTVAFTALPIMTNNGPDATVKSTNWNVVEYQSPAGYKAVSIPFSKVTFDTRQGRTVQQLKDEVGSGPIMADNTLTFGAYGPAHTPATPIKYNGVNVDAYMVNFTVDDHGTDVPARLPLTGGRGIVLLLVVGLAVMGGALYIRNRRNATQA